MDIKTKRNCILCLRAATKCDYEFFEDIHQEILEVLRIDVDIKKGRKSVICNECQKRTNESFAFKSNCLYKEDNITPFIESQCQNGIKLNLIQILQTINNNNEENVSLDKKICRFCMKIVEQISFTPLKDINMSEMTLLQKYIPEMNLTATVDPVICEICLSCLKDHFDFINVLAAHQDVTENISDRKSDLNPSRSPKASKISIRTISSKERATTVCRQRKQGKNSGGNQPHGKTGAKRRKQSIVYKCENCDFKSFHSSSLYKHRNLHKDIATVKLYKCDACPFQTIYKHTLVGHKRTHELVLSTVGQHKCPQCEYKSMKLSSIKNHMVCHDSSPNVQLYECPHCPFKTKHPPSLKYHLVIHADVPPLKCELCSFKTKHKRILDAHRLTHDKEKKYKCEQCGHQTSQKSYLVRHMRRHAENSLNQIYCCDQCPYKSNRKQLLTTHMRRHRETKQQFKCEQCPFISRYKTSVERHAIVHKDISEVTRYKCEVCPYQSKYKHEIVRHQKVHKSAVYKCELCDFESKHLGSVRSHQKLKHTKSSELETFECAECGFQTKNKHVLKNHVVIHLRVFYNCSLCDYQTKHKRNMCSHYKVAHNRKNHKLLTD